MRIRPSEATLSAARQSRISPTVTIAPVRSRNVSDTSARRHDSLVTCLATAFTELDKINASRKPRCSAIRRIRSSSEMPHRSVSASGESATINNGGRKGSVILGVPSSETDLARMLRYARPKHFVKNFGGSRHSLVASRQYAARLLVLISCLGPSWLHANPDFAALCTAKTECRPQAIARCIRISFKRISRVNAIIIDHHYKCISVASRKLFLNRLTISEIT